MSNNWYFAKNGKKVGPFSFDQLRQLMAAGTLTPIDEVLNEGGSQWVTARIVPGLLPSTESTADQVADKRPRPEANAAAVAPTARSDGASTSRKGPVLWLTPVCVVVALIAGKCLMNYQRMSPEELLKVMQEGSPADQPEADQPFAQGQAALKQHNVDVAITAFTDAIHRDPKNAEAYYLRGVAYGEKGDAVRAIADRTKAIRLKPALANSPPK
jgi:cytochrome c-type biogenesis protein CcmH/NrfG